MLDKLKASIKKTGGLDMYLSMINENNKLLKTIKRRNDELYWGQIFNNAIQSSEWLKNKSLNPGRWAAGYPFLYILYRIYNEIKPKSVLEFGLGESTKLGYQYHLHNPDSKITILEQDKNWLDFFSKQHYNVAPMTVLTEIKKSTVNNCEVNVYVDLIEKIGGSLYDLLVIDGPWGSENYSRYQIVDVIENNLLSDDFIILLDDYERDGEKQTAEEVRKLLEKRSIKYAEGVYAGEKETWIVCSVKFKFLTTL